MSEGARLERRGAAAILWLDRPAVHNVVDLATIGKLETLLAKLDAMGPEVRCLVLAGAGEASFCAGSDLGELATMTTEAEREAGLAMSPRMHAILDRLDRGPQVTLAALAGGAYGGGCELITACHLRIASDDARFSFRQAAMGVVTGWGGGVRLFRQVGRAGALRLLLTADTIDAQEALRLGLVDFLAAREEVLPQALDLAHRIARLHPESIAGFLELARSVAEDGPAAARDTERRLFAELWRGEAFWREVDAWRRRKG